jgi:hypothetical protein
MELPAEGLTRKDWMKRTLALGERLYLSGEIEDREAISKHKLETAFQLLRDLGLVTVGGKGQVEPAPRAREAIDEWREQLKAYLR